MLDIGVTLDKRQLRDVTLDDAELMQEILASLIDDTSRQIQLLETAIRDCDADRCGRLAHYSRGACANIGAVCAAQLLKDIETRAADRKFDECGEALAALLQQVDQLREEAAALAA